jgi:hypothetical protein
MMKNMNKKSILLLLIMTVSFGLGASPLQTWDHDFNPALLSTGNRKSVELGMSFNAALANSYFTLEELFPADGVLVLDFDDIADDLNGKDLELAFSIEMEEHFVMTAKKVSVGQYATVNGAVSVAIPGNLFEVIADGIETGETYSDESEIYAKVFATTGIYGGYRWKDWQFSAKFGAFTPLIYSDSDASFYYSAENEEDGTFSASAGADIPLYSLFNLEDGDFDAASIPEYLGYNLDLGAIKMKDDKPFYGFSLTGLTLSPAVMPYTTTFSTSTSVTSTDSLVNYDENDEPWTTETEDMEYETTEETYRVSLPLVLGGFYRLSGYPSFIDWIGTGEITLDDGDVYLGGGITAEGAIFPLNALNLTLEYDKFFWETSMGLRFNVRFIEMGLDVGLSNTRFVNLFSPSGVNVGYYMALGF